MFVDVIITTISSFRIIDKNAMKEMELTASTTTSTTTTTNKTKTNKKGIGVYPLIMKI